jgi:UDP-glucose 4-epimerase
MKILITGVSGFIGQTLLEHVQQKYADITGLDKEMHGKENGRFARFVICDLSNKSEAEHSCKGIDTIIHLAGEANVQARKEIHFRNNYLCSLNLLQSAKRYKVNKIVFLSSIKAANNSHYGSTKYNVEKEIIQLSKTTQTSYTILRCAIVYGPGMRSSIANWINLTRKKWFPALPKSNSSVEMIGINDLCKAIEICISDNTTDNKMYELSDGNAYNVNEIERHSREFFQNQKPIFRVPIPVVYLLAKLGDVCAFFNIKLPINSISYNILFNNIIVRDKPFELDTGFQPMQNFFDEIPHIFQRNKK